MKNLLNILFCFQFIISFGQSNDVIKFQNDVISKQLMDYDGETRISTLISSPWIEYHLSILRDTNEHMHKFKARTNADSLTLTESETDLIIQFFENPENLKLTYNPTKFTTIDTSKVINHLKKNYYHQIIFISKPLFIRDSKIGIAFFANLCCGGITGPVNFSFYRKENDIWKRWIDISSGEF